MRLFEVDLGSARSVLAVLQGIANNDKHSSELSFPVVMNVLRPFGLGISTPDGLIALKDEIDPAGDVIRDILDNGTVILNTNKTSSIKKDPERSPSADIDSLAKQGAKKLSPDI